MLDSATGRWTAGAALNASRSAFAAIRLNDGRVLDAWSATAAMPSADRPGAAVLLADGSVIVAGGTVPLGEAVVDAPPTSVGWTAQSRPEEAAGG